MAWWRPRLSGRSPRRRSQYLAVAPNPALLAAAAARPRRPAAPPVAEAAGAAATAGGADGIGAELVEGPGSEQPLWGGPEDLEDATLVLGEDEGEGGEAAGR